MSESERRIADTQGKFAQAVKNGRTLNDAGWTSGRILLSNKRLILVSSGGKRTIPLSEIEALGDRYDINQRIARETRYLSLEFDDNDVVLIAARDTEAFEHDFYSALLDQQIVLVRHPAVKGGVVQDTEWEKARIKLEEESVNVATTTGTFIEVEMDDIGTVEVVDRTVMDEPRTVIEVEHTIEGTSVETYFSGGDRYCSFMKSLFSKGQEQNEAELELSQSEKQVLMGLYSGVSPFEIPDFADMSVEEVEETFDRLIELDVLDEVRKRREVALTTRGRNIASEAINDE